MLFYEPKACVVVKSTIPVGFIDYLKSVLIQIQLYFP